VGKPSSLERDSQELIRVLLDSAYRLHARGDRARAREAYQKAVTISQAAGAPGRELGLRFTELAAAIGAPAKPPKAQAGGKRARRAGA
jgi:hypothetical protein